MERCPICRAQLNGADTCRRCRADLGTIKDVVRRSEALAEAGLHRLALGEVATAARLLGRANQLHATPEIGWLLSRIEGVRGASDDGPIANSGAGAAAELRPTATALDDGGFDFSP